MNKRIVCEPSELTRTVTSKPSTGAKSRNLSRPELKVMLANQVRPNLNHPLASLSAESRTMERVRAIAAVLARLSRDKVTCTTSQGREVE